MGGGQAHPGLPVANPTESYWQIPPHGLADHRSTPDLPTNTVFDYVVVGSGISGAAVAYTLLRQSPQLKILMLEARTAASGASGRNGGHCRAGFWLNFRRYVAAHGEDEALKCERFEEDNIMDMLSFVGASQAECDFRNITTADTYMTEEAWDGVKDVVQFRDEIRRRRPEAGPLTPRTLLEGDQARHELGMANIVGAVTWPAYTLDPYRLVCRMLELSMARGLNLQTNTPAYRLGSRAEHSDPECRWTVETERGTIRTQTVVLATNAYTNVLYPELAATGFLWPARSQLTAIRPGTNMTDNPALNGSAAIHDLGSGDYFQVRAPGFRGEGDILWGGGRSVSSTRERGIIDDAHIHPGIASHLHEAPAKFFGKSAWGRGDDVVRDWTGITCYTPDTFPLIGEAPDQPGLWMSVGMNGHGMALAYRSAKALVQMMTTGKEPSWFPASFRLARAWDSPGAVAQ